MKFKDLVQNLSIELNLPARKSKILASIILKHLAGSIKNGEGFSSPLFNVKVRNIPVKQAIDKITGKPIFLEASKIGIVKIKKLKL